MWGLPPGTVLRELAANAAMGVPSIRRRRLKGLRTRNESPAEEARKIVAEYDFFSDPAGDLSGKCVVEIGPGDAIGLAPLFLTAGAARYVVVDRFPGDIWGAQAQALYAELERIRGPFVADWRSRVAAVRTAIEADGSGVPAADVLVSFDVIEHLADLPRAVRNMSRILKPEGRMIHRVDYGPHGVWLGTSDPFDFLTVPGWLWSAIGSNRGYPNRVRHPQFIELLEAQGLEVTQRITRSHGSDALDAEVACAFGTPLKLGRTFESCAGDHASAR